MSVCSYPEGKTTMLRANVILVSELVGLFGEAVEDEHSDHGKEADDAMGGAMVNTL